jgi:hypothetical protein
MQDSPGKPPLTSAHSEPHRQRQFVGWNLKIPCDTLEVQRDSPLNSKVRRIVPVRQIIAGWREGRISNGDHPGARLN